MLFTAWKKLPRDHPARRWGHKYITTKDVVYQSTLLSGWGDKIVTSESGFVTFDPFQHQLKIKKGWTWDGASGPTFDTANTMLGSLLHDALYDLFSAGLLDGKMYRDIADLLLRRVCIEQGMSEWRGNLWVWAVLTFGKRHARKKRVKKR